MPTESEGSVLGAGGKPNPAGSYHLGTHEPWGLHPESALGQQHCSFLACSWGSEGGGECRCKQVGCCVMDLLGDGSGRHLTGVEAGGDLQYLSPLFIPLMRRRSNRLWL